MKRMRGIWASILLALLLSSCSPETDFIISDTTQEQTASFYEEETGIFVVINKNSSKYHTDPDCVYASRMAKDNRLEIKVSDLNYLEKYGYAACFGCTGKQ